jgi:hypothetical protein
MDRVDVSGSRVEAGWHPDILDRMPHPVPVTGAGLLQGPCEASAPPLTRTRGAWGSSPVRRMPPESIEPAASGGGLD